MTRLEARYAEFDGLNLTWETLEGLVKHNGPLADANGKGLKGPVPQAIRDYSELHDLRLSETPGWKPSARRSPTTSPTIRMTSTMVCGPAC